MASRPCEQERQRLAHPSNICRCCFVVTLVTITHQQPDLERASPKSRVQPMLRVLCAHSRQYAGSARSRNEVKLPQSSQALSPRKSKSLAYLWISDKFRCKGQVCAVGNAVLLQAITYNHTCLVQELEGERWKLLWSGRLYSRTSAIELDNPVRLPALGARGFLLHNPEHDVRMSSPNTGQVKSPILVRGSFRTCCKR